MNYLLDTHAFLWRLFDDPKLSSISRSIIGDPKNTINVRRGQVLYYNNINLCFDHGVLTVGITNE